MSYTQLVNSESDYKTMSERIFPVGSINSFCIFPKDYNCFHLESHFFSLVYTQSRITITDF